MSIQIVDAANPAARQEVRERIGGLNLAREAMWHDREESEEVRAESRKRYHEELKALYYALTGTHPTAEEVKELAASDFQSE